jgi:hypothetical protein
VLWLDALVMNRDRTPGNPNIVVAQGRSWLVDHGAAPPFHYDWSSVTEALTVSERPSTTEQE